MARVLKRDANGDVSKRALSYSQLSKFLQCEMAWYLAYVKGHASEPNKYMFFGSLMHGLLEASYEKRRVLTNRQMVKVFNDLASDSQYEGANIDFPYEMVRAFKLYGYYAEWWDGEFANTEVVAIEEVKTDGELTGVADLLLVQYGGLWLREHKTRTQFIQQPADIQVHMYKRLWPELEGIEYNQIKSYEYKNEPDPSKLFLRIPIFSTDQDQETLDYTITESMGRMDAIRNGKLPVPAFTYHNCSRCDYKAICPAVAGKEV